MQVYGITRDLLPAGSADGTQQQFRAGEFGEQFVVPLSAGLYGLANEGSYFKATSPTPGTGIAMGIQTSFSDTANVLAILRNNNGGGGKSIYLDYLRLICTAAGASTTSSRMAIILDTANRYSSGGTAITPVNPNSGIANATGALLHFGAVTALAATGGKRILGTLGLKTQATPCWTVGDEVYINFGGQDSANGSLSGAAAFRSSQPFSPVILAPGNQHSLLFHMWNVANATTAPSWEFDLGYWER